MKDSKGDKDKKMKYKEIKITKDHKVFVPVQDKFTEDLLNLSSYRMEHYAMFGEAWKDHIIVEPLLQDKSISLEKYLEYLEGVIKIMR